MSSIYARVSAQGTACSETALCSAHLSLAGEYPGSDITEPAVSAHIDCSGNDAIACQKCGAHA